MPKEFRFPVNDRYWIPLHFGPQERERADALSLTVFGRLAAGATIEHAQAELDVIGSRMAVVRPETHGHLRPRVLSYTRACFDIDSPEIVWSLYMFRLFVSLLLVVVAVNVAILMYASCPSGSTCVCRPRSSYTPLASRFSALRSSASFPRCRQPDDGCRPVCSGC